MNKIFLTILLTTGLLSASEIKIAENGKACVGILIPPNPRPIVKVAASELAMYLKKITGADFTRCGLSVGFRFRALSLR